MTAFQDVVARTRVITVALVSFVACSEEPPPLYECKEVGISQEGLTIAGLNHHCGLDECGDGATCQGTQVTVCGTLQWANTCHPNGNTGGSGGLEDDCPDGEKFFFYQNASGASVDDVLSGSPGFVEASAQTDDNAGFFDKLWESYEEDSEFSKPAVVVATIELWEATGLDCPTNAKLNLKRADDFSWVDE